MESTSTPSIPHTNPYDSPPAEQEVSWHQVHDVITSLKLPILLPLHQRIVTVTEASAPEPFSKALGELEDYLDVLDNSGQLSFERQRLIKEYVMRGWRAWRERFTNEQRQLTNNSDIKQNSINHWPHGSQAKTSNVNATMAEILQTQTPDFDRSKMLLDVGSNTTDSVRQPDGSWKVVGQGSPQQDMNPKAVPRTSGFYRVKEDGKWTIAKYEARWARWHSIGEGGCCEDDSWQEIEPEPIQMHADDYQK